VRRIDPIAAGAVVLATVVLAALLVRHDPPGPLWACGPVALLVLRLRTGRRTTIVLAVAMLVVLTVTAIAAGGQVATLLPLVFLGWSVAAVTLGEVIRGRAARVRALRTSREEETRRRLAEERLRIARDLHDGVAHAMATINVQAGAAAHVLQRRPEAAGAALEAIRQASGEALDELTAMLRVLRDPASTAPKPGLDGLADLVGSVRAGGLAVSLTIDGPAESVPAPTSTAAYRIVQESLTNVIRHAKASTAAVTVVASADRGLWVEIRDDGHSSPLGDESDKSGKSGVGIQGMRERAESTGGTLVAGPSADGGFRVGARWEIAPSPGGKAPQSPRRATLESAGGEAPQSAHPKETRG
jgi:signal transduction histidine kinase